MNIFRLIQEFMDVYKFIIMSHFSWSIITICGTLLIITVELVQVFLEFCFHLLWYFCNTFQSDANIDPLLLASSVGEVFWSFSIVFIYCDFGERVTSEFNQITEAVYQFDWYTFPMKIQQMMPNIIIATQEPVVVRGFANTMCTRESFKMVSINEFAASILFSMTQFEIKEWQYSIVHLLFFRWSMEVFLTSWLYVDSVIKTHYHEQISSGRITLFSKMVLNVLPCKILFLLKNTLANNIFIGLVELLLRANVCGNAILSLNICEFGWFIQYKKKFKNKIRKQTIKLSILIRTLKIRYILVFVLHLKKYRKKFQKSM